MRVFWSLQAALFLVFSSAAQGQDASLRQRQNTDIETGAALYEENCALCHGVNLEGQAGWRSQDTNGLLPAPPHDRTGHTWHHGDSLLFSYTRLGGQAALANIGVEGFQSGMPAFQGILTYQEIWDIIAFIKSTWPKEIQDIQSTRTR